eukprot:13176494-Alexandrium_andersonii.AAC.1
MHVGPLRTSRLPGDLNLASPPGIRGCVARTAGRTARARLRVRVRVRPGTCSGPTAAADPTPTR